ncbi:MipA/OmpV family protein [Variovorax sp. LT1R16]|uniref:MipA/OmpV family protein n=1 Tax=Variovorax sp. LT1R16 TaxID=3443728 RepID=UPI003F46A8BE
MNETRTPVSDRARTRGRALLIGTALGAMMAPAAWAQPTFGATDDWSDGRSQWGLGVGLGFERKPYREFDDKAQGIPLILYENKYVNLVGPTLDVKLPSAGPVSFRLRARYVDEGYKSDDSPFLAGMDERKASFWLGGAATWRNDFGNLSAEFLADGSGNSKGTKFKLQLDRRLKSGAFDITPRIAANWMDKKYVNYYYGVSSTEVTADRAFYEGRSAVNFELGVRVGYDIAPKQNVFVDLSATTLGSGIKNSPLVDRSSSATVRVGYVYRF